MNFEEHAAKPLLLGAGIAVPPGELVASAEAAGDVARRLGPVVVKAQVPAGKRGKAGGIRPAASPSEARLAAGEILGMRIAGHMVERVLVEGQCRIAHEYYAAVLNDPATKGPLVLFSAQGGMDVEALAADAPDALHRAAVDIRVGFDEAMGRDLLRDVAQASSRDELTALLSRLYTVYRENDAELLEVNPLALTQEGTLVALDCKLVVDDSALTRRPALAELGVPDALTELEARAKAAGLKYIELDGDVGVLANGAGLTMTTMDVVQHHGGRPANFMEIGGDAYTLAKPALELVLANPRVKSLVVNFCGAFARTDVMVEGVIGALRELKPTTPVFFSVHGTGEAEAVAALRSSLGIEPFDTMDEAVVAAINAARRGP